jgi:hypothetical protein
MDGNQHCRPGIQRSRARGFTEVARMSVSDRRATYANPLLMWTHGISMPEFKRWLPSRTTE